jgi:hypothetical protein
MNFTSALNVMRNGKQVKRTGWTDGYCCLMPDMASIWRILTAPQVQTGNYLPLVDDLLADDWEEYTGKPKVIDAPAQATETEVPVDPA